MRIRLDDIAVFVADWRPKPEQLRSVAETLDIGIDSLVFVDDNPAEREAVRQMLPEVDVVALPPDPAGYVDALADYLLFEPGVVHGRGRPAYGALPCAQPGGRGGRVRRDDRGLLPLASTCGPSSSPFTEDDLPRVDAARWQDEPVQRDDEASFGRHARGVRGRSGLCAPDLPAARPLHRPRAHLRSSSRSRGTACSRSTRG